jgi:5'-methylthioadenosine phosphorylase
MAPRTLAILGGSGLYAMADLTRVEEHRVTTPFGEPSDAVVSGYVGDTRLLFLPRHGRGHRVAPHEINYRANIFALKALGAEQLVSVSAVGSLREDIAPGELVVVDQYIDRTWHRRGTFFEGAGVVAHVSLADPTDAALRTALVAAATKAGGKVWDKGTYVCIEGPQFSTRAESHLYRSWGASVIGMTSVPEVRLAREAELPFSTLALVTDYDCWRDEGEHVTVGAVVEVMKQNVNLAQNAIRNLAATLPDPAKSPATRALDGAVMTDPALISKEARERFAPLLQKYFK